MADAPDSPYRIRPLRRTDRSAVRDICVATCWLGEKRLDAIPDDWLWAEYWTRYFTDRQRRLSWVAADARDGRVVGYLTGTHDSRRFDAYAPYLLGGVICRIIRKRLISRAAPRNILRNFLRSALRGEQDVPPRLLASYPATWHFNLLPEARRQGLGTELLSRFFQRLDDMHVPGVHAHALSVNAASIAACKRMGMELLHESPMTAFAHIHPGPMTIQMWAKQLTR
jgi:GNAT superfamily N-acetyltransferase